MKIKLIIYSIIILISFLIFSGNYGLIDPDEPRYATTAKNMIQTGNYLVPYFNGEPRLNKPPLTYWLISTSFNLFGINEFTSRLPHIICALLIIFFSIIFLKIYDIHFLLVSSSIPIFFYLGRFCNTDIILTTFFSSALIFFYNFYKNDNKIFLFLFFFFYFLATLTKGPVALLIIPIIIIFLIFEKNFIFFKKIYIWFILLALSLSPIIYLFIVKNFSNIDLDIIKLIKTETASRFLKGYRHPEPVYFYIEYFPLIFFPWSIFFIFKFPKVLKLIKNNTFGKFCLIWFLFIFIFFTFSKSKLISYILPSTIPFSYLTSQVIKDFKFNITYKFLWIFFAFILLGIFIFLKYNHISLPGFNVILLFIIISISYLSIIFFEKDTIIKIGIFNLLLFLTIFSIGSNFINETKTDLFIKPYKKLIENYPLLTFRRDFTGLAFYCKNYKEITFKKELMPYLDKYDKVYMVVYKHDIKRYFKWAKLDQLPYNIITKTKKRMLISFEK